MWNMRISVGAALLFAFGAAVAMPMPPTYSACSTDLAQSVDGTVDCIAIDGTSFNDEGNKWWINDISFSGGLDPLFGGSEGWSQLPMYDDAGYVGFITNTNGAAVDEGMNLTAGSFGIAAWVFEMYEEVMLFYKDGQTHAGFIIDPLGYSDVGGFVTDNFGNGLVLIAGCSVGDCYGGDFINAIPSGQAISHVNLWVRGEQRRVSEPGTLALLGLGLLGLGRVWRLRNRSR